MGIEPTSEAWEASILPLYDARLFLTVGSLYLTSDRLVQLQKTQHSWLYHFLSCKVLFSLEKPLTAFHACNAARPNYGIARQVRSYQAIMSTSLFCVTI